MKTPLCSAKRLSAWGYRRGNGSVTISFDDGPSAAQAPIFKADLTQVC
jgi:hypothetical protein